MHQINIAHVANRVNTGSGFFTELDVETDRLLDGVRSPVGDVAATVKGLEFGMGFLLWVKRRRDLRHNLAYGPRVRAPRAPQALDF